MDFGTLLHVAKKNNEVNKSSSEGKYYSTKFTAPKKETKEKKLSDNIKRFLAKKEQEEREKARIEKQKRDQLLAMRDEKSKNKIKKMLKVIKSANKSVLEDAIDNQNTAVTIQGPDQPDEDDYGYVSQEAAALYSKYMDKVKTTPEDSKFSASRPASKTDLGGIKDRVKAAIQKEQDERENPIKTKTRTSSSTGDSSPPQSSSSSSLTEKIARRRKDLYDAEAEREEQEKKRKDEKAKFKKPLPPPTLDFQELLRLAEKKQHEPVEIAVETKKEPERLLTKKEKREMEERRAYFEEKERRRKAALQQPNKMQPNGKIPKLNGATANSQPSSSSGGDSKKNLPERPPAKQSTLPSSSSSQKSILNGPSLSRESTQKLPQSGSAAIKKPQNSPAPSSVNKTLSATKPKSMTDTKSTTSSQQNGKIPINTNSKPVSNNSKSLSLASSKSVGTKSGTGNHASALSSQPAKSNINGSVRQLPPKDLQVRKDMMKGRDVEKTRQLPSKDAEKTRQFPPRDVERTKQLQPRDVERTKQFPPRDVERTRQFPPRDVERTRQFPPRDVERTRQFPPSDVRSSKPSKKPIKRRILDDDDDDYDSELDDFIDDGPEEDQNYSSYIKEIFGYDKSRYRDYEEDDDAMESTFAQQMREEYVSKKIGLLEDLEDMRQEAEEKKKKAMKKKIKLK